MDIRARRQARPVRALVVLAGVGFLGLSACSDDEPSGPDDAAATSEPTPQDRLDQAHDVLSSAGSVSLGMVGSSLPESESAYVIGAEGSGTLEPAAFEGTITAKLTGIQADVPTIAVDDLLYLELPFTGRYAETDPDSLNVPDPAGLFDLETGLVSLLKKTDNPQFGEQSRAGADVVQEVSGTLPGDLIVDLLNAGAPEATFDVVYGLVEESWEARTVTLTGPFYPPAESTYTVTLDDYGVPVEITAP
ncbi:MAG: LppX_LprAFG lipoprotein [Ornithinimicrobium sp.]|uniref:LppX_LprAFG lipoprotein n=1 Tax=Ornithinimicrobium sp. TaxID=1977084 RepID=UPI003D9ACD14